MAAVRVGLVGDIFIVNPSAAEMTDSRLDLMLAGTGDRVAMIEGYCKWLSNAEMAEVWTITCDPAACIRACYRYL